MILSQEEYANRPGAALIAEGPTLDELYWCDTSEVGDKSRLLSWITIGGCSMHLEAFESTEDAEGNQVFVGAYAETANMLIGEVEGDEWDTVTIEGRQYVLIVYPFS